MSIMLSMVSRRLERLCDNGGEQSVDIHIAGSIATGTGGGTMLDILAQLQSYLSNQPWRTTIYVHAFTTAADVGDKNTGRFYINQYAALKEYNAFNRSDYKPWDIKNPPHAKRLSIKPVNASAEDTNHYDLKQTYKSLFLVTDSTSEGKRVSLPEQVNGTAELLFQLSVRQLGNLPNEIRQALSNEDNPETTDEGFTGPRSMKNGAYGVHRITIPETKIRQRLISSLGLQFTLQILHNNWVKSFVDDPTTAFNAKSFVADLVKNLEVSKGDLWLDKAVGKTKFSEETSFAAYQQDWRLKLEEIEKNTKTADSYQEMQQWVTVFNREAELYWNEGFRPLGDQGGVERYFGFHGSPIQLDKRSNSVRKHIEALLVDGLESGLENYTTHNLPDIVENLIERVEDEAANFAKRSAGYEKMAIAAQKKRVTIKEEIRRIGKIGYKIGGAALRLFAQYQEESVVFYSNRTYERASKYGAAFSLELLDSLRLLRKDVGQFKRNITNLRDNFVTDLNLENEKKSGIEDWINWDEINESIQQYFVTNKPLLETNSNAIWDQLKELRGDRKSFDSYNRLMVIDEKTSVVRGEFPSAIRKESLQYSHTFHADVVENNPTFKPFFGRNIVKELYEQYGEVTKQLENVVKRWIDASSPMVAFDAGQPRPSVPKPGPRKRRMMLLPTCQDVPKSFQDALKACIEGSLSNNDGKILVKTIPEERCPNEISALTVAFFFPLRQAAVVSALKVHYDRALMSNEGRFVSYQCHSESARFSDLLLPSRSEEMEIRLPSILAACALGYLQVPDDLDKQLYFGTREDKFSPIENRIDTGIKFTLKQKELAARIGDQYDEMDISVELAILYTDYHEQFLRDCGSKVEALLNSIEVVPEHIDAAELKLKNYSKWVFLLAKRNEEDERYGKFKDAIYDAINRVLPELKEKL
ncbi:hypothetical protein CS022_13590 [Veronia nyctiphanis]|uniref:Uncharacterized protein n=1 Tax=Veronia nyctiphanis TaxID=1278244 RepID=A0A4Q0YQL5_9GAMM|nr:tubulin-like doman-containing protein [Veronia nyctiphanis]RXJ72875.1 hypothetical protein CS022_13590 [Veronia nyctiphanis]